MTIMAKGNYGIALNVHLPPALADAVDAAAVYPIRKKELVAAALDAFLRLSRREQIAAVQESMQRYYGGPEAVGDVEPPVSAPGEGAASPTARPDESRGTSAEARSAVLRRAGVVPPAPAVPGRHRRRSEGA